MNKKYLLKIIIETVKINGIYNLITGKFQKSVYYNSSGIFEEKIEKGGFLKKVI